MVRYSPRDLGAIDAVEIVDLRGQRAGGVSEFMRIALLNSVTLSGSAAQRIAALWRTLSPGEPSRCHVPPFGLRLIRGGKVVVEASLCWRCNNAFGYQGAEAISFEFCGDAEKSRELLTLVKAAWGE